MNVLKKFITLFFIVFSCLSMSLANAASKTTTYSMCTKNLVDEKKTLTIIVAMETLSESSCNKFGKKKAEQYALVGWRCVGKRNEPLYSCESDRASAFANYNGTKLDNLTFTNLQKHRSLVAYINPNSNKICHEDRDELVSAGVKDAVCHRSDL